MVCEFRNYAHAELALDRDPVVLAGPNGSGKTNLLEAISFLAPGRGLRRARLGDVTRRRSRGFDPPPDRAWAVAATMMGAQGPREIGTGLDLARSEAVGDGRDRRVVKLDGEFVRSQRALGDIAVVVWLTPVMDRLFLEGPSARRRFVDRLVCGFDPAHADRLSSYEYALRERGRLLHAGIADAQWLRALEDIMARRGIAIAAARREWLTRLAAACVMQAGPFPKADLALTGGVEAWLDEMPALAAEDTLRRRLADLRTRDAHAGGAAEGPHRTDLAVRYLETDRPAAECSTGEQKALLLTITLAYVRLLALNRALSPLVLLDEVAAHLDASRRSALFQEILSLGCQAWLTGTDPALFADLKGIAQFFDVRDGAAFRLGATPKDT